MHSAGALFANGFVSEDFRSAMNPTLFLTLALLVPVSLDGLPAVSFDVVSEKKAVSILAVRMVSHNLDPGEIRIAEDFHFSISGKSIRVDMKSDVGEFPAGTVLLTEIGADLVTVLTPARRTYSVVPLDTIAREQTPSFDRIENVLADLKSIRTVEGTTKREIKMRVDVSVTDRMTARCSFHLVITSRDEPDLEPAKRLLYVLLRQNFDHLDPAYAAVVQRVYPVNFPISERIMAGGSLAKPHSPSPASPTWGDDHLRFEVRNITRGEVEGGTFSIPSGYTQVLHRALK